MICSFFAKKEPKKLSSKISRRVTPCGIFLWEVPVLPCKQGTHRNEPVGRGLDPAGEWAAMWAIFFARKGRKISTKISRGGQSPLGIFFIKSSFGSFPGAAGRATVRTCSLPGAAARNEGAAILYVWQGRMTRQVQPGSRAGQCRGPAPLHPKQEKNSPLVQLNITTSSLGFSPGSTLRAVSTGPVASGVWPW